MEQRKSSFHSCPKDCWRTSLSEICFLERFVIMLQPKPKASKIVATIWPSRSLHNEIYNRAGSDCVAQQRSGPESRKGALGLLFTIAQKGEQAKRGSTG